MNISIKTLTNIYKTNGVLPAKFKVEVHSRGHLTHEDISDALHALTTNTVEDYLAEDSSSQSILLLAIAQRHLEDREHNLRSPRNRSAMKGGSKRGLRVA